MTYIFSSLFAYNDYLVKVKSMIKFLILIVDTLDLNAYFMIKR